jgi:hypothetical protein
MKNTRDKMKAPPVKETGEEMESGYVSAPLFDVGAKGRDP